MKTNTLIVSCFVLGSSSVAMADPAFTFQARSSVNASAGIHVGPVVRDHHTAPPITRPRVYLSAYDRTGARFERTDRFDRFDRPSRFAPALPSLTGPTWDCHNWDPTVDVSSVCTAYASSRPGRVPQATGAGIVLGVRDAAIPDHQYITVGPGERFRKIVVEGNDCAPEIARIGIKFTDGSLQVVNTNQRLRDGRSMSIALDGGYREINQIVIYTPSGATGSYTVRAR